VAGIATEKSAQPAVHAPDLIQAGLHGLARGGFAAGEFGGQLPGGELVEHETGRPHSTILGTTNRPPDLAGALPSASSLLREGRARSGRNTLTSGTAWAVGSMPL